MLFKCHEGADLAAPEQAMRDPMRMGGHAYAGDLGLEETAPGSSNGVGFKTEEARTYTYSNQKVR